LAALLSPELATKHRKFLSFRLFAFHYRAIYHLIFKMGRYSKRAAQLAKARVMRSGQKKVTSNIVPPLSPTLASQNTDDQPLQTNDVDEADSSSQPSFPTADHSTDEDAIDSELSLEESSCDESSSESDSGSNHTIVEADAVDSSRSAFSTLRWKENAGSTLKRSYGSGSKSTEKRHRKATTEISARSRSRERRNLENYGNLRTTA